jgi:hypothetical protein
MKKLSSRGLQILTLAVAAIPNWASAKGNLADDLIGNLYAMKSVYEATYAPADWKEKFTNYSLNQEFEKAVAAARSNPNLSYADTRLILKNIIYAMRDYHVSISFIATESATLPFTVRSSGDKYYLVYIDRSKLPAENFPFQVGDELVEFGGKPTAEAVNEVQAQFIENVAGTDRATAETRLTNRTAARGLLIPQGPINLAIKKRGASSISKHQLLWDYVPEKVSPRRSLKYSALSIPDEPAKVQTSALLKPVMSVSVDPSSNLDNPYALGTRKSFVPNLGSKVWESGDSNYFDAYIYQAPDRRLIGYIRIASYSTPDYMKATSDFRKIIERFEGSTDALVIDQVNNPGGSVFYLYTLVSMLSDQPMKTPRHRMAITQADVFEALDTIEKLKDVKNDEDAKKALPIAENHGYPSTYEFAQFTLSYSRFIVSEWNAGRKLSEPYWIAGVDQINPDPTHYTKPILLLTNPLDYSGGDFFPAILQDNKRVTIMGTRTAGAGGYVVNAQIPNTLGINFFRVTQSIAERVDGNPIENLGVTPDLPYEMTAEDYTGNYAPYVKAVQNAVIGLIK